MKKLLPFILGCLTIGLIWIGVILYKMFPDYGQRVIADFKTTMYFVCGGFMVIMGIIAVVGIFIDAIKDSTIQHGGKWGRFMEYVDGNGMMVALLLLSFGTIALMTSWIIGICLLGLIIFTINRWS